MRSHPTPSVLRRPNRVKQRRFDAVSEPEGGSRFEPASACHAEEVTAAGRLTCTVLIITSTAIAHRSLASAKRLWFSRSRGSNLGKLHIERIAIGDVSTPGPVRTIPTIAGILSSRMRGAFSSVSSPSSFPAIRVIFRQPIESLCCLRSTAPCTLTTPPSTHGPVTPFILTFVLAEFSIWARHSKLT